MSRYRKVATLIWNDQKFMELGDRAKLAFLFLLTHPHMTSLGAMRGTIEGLASELSTPPGKASESLPEDLSEAFREVFRKGLAVYDEKAHLVWLPNFLKYNGPESPNVVKAWASCIDLLPECETKALVIQRVTELSKDLPKAFREVFNKTFPKPSESLSKAFPYPEQEQEQEQEQERFVGASPPPTTKTNLDDKYTGGPRALGSIGLGLKASHR